MLTLLLGALTSWSGGKLPEGSSVREDPGISGWKIGSSPLLVSAAMETDGGLSGSGRPGRVARSCRGPQVTQLDALMTPCCPGGFFPAASGDSSLLVH